jgi:hypothetical protein
LDLCVTSLDEAVVLIAKGFWSSGAVLAISISNDL